MNKRTALIAADDRKYEKYIGKQLDKLGYRTITLKKHSFRDRSAFIQNTNIDALIMFLSEKSSERNDHQLIREAAEKMRKDNSGKIIGVSLTENLPYKLKYNSLMSSYGFEELLRESFLCSNVKIGFIRSIEADDISCHIHDMYQRHGTISRKIAEHLNSLSDPKHRNTAYKA